MAASNTPQMGGAFDPTKDVNFSGAVDFGTTVPTVGSASVVTTTGTQTLTNKTLTSPTITAPAISAAALTGAYTLAPIVITASADGALTITATGLTVVKLTKSGVAAMTLADPAAGLEGAVVVFTATTANAHTVSNAAGSGFNAGGAASDVATFGGAVGDGFAIVAAGQKWNVIVTKNVTLG